MIIVKLLAIIWNLELCLEIEKKENYSTFKKAEDDSIR